MGRAIDAEYVESILNGWLNDLPDGEETPAIEACLNVVKTAPILPQPSNEPLPIFVLDEPGREYIDYICPGCGDIISQQRRGQRMNTVYQCKYHDGCGQRVDWSKPQPYRRPPEGEV